MSLIAIKIENWENYLYRKDIKVCSWVRLQNDIFTSQKLYHFSVIEKAFFIFLLCEASKKVSDVIKINLEYLRDSFKLEESEVLEIIKKWESNGTLTLRTRTDTQSNFENTCCKGRESKESKGNEESNKLLSSAESDKKTRAEFLEIKKFLKKPSTNNPKKISFNFETGKFENIPSLLMTKWGESFPALQVKHELAHMEAWLLANPKNKKSNYERFITNWLSRAQDSAARSTITGPADFRTVSKAQATVDKVMNYKNPYATEKNVIETKVENEK